MPFGGGYGLNWVMHRLFGFYDQSALEDDRQADRARVDLCAARSAAGANRACAPW